MRHLVFITFALAPIPALAADCKSELAAFQAAAESAHLPTVDAAIVQVDVACPPRAGAVVRALRGSLRARLARRDWEAGDDPRALAATLERERQFGDHWELRALLGELAQANREHQRAAEHFLAAMDLIEDEVRTPAVPDTTEVMALHHRASDALTLAGEPVSARTRSGEPRAYYRARLRGIKLPTKRPQITFVTDTADFDRIGQVAIRELTQIVAREASQELFIAAHADPRGADDYNLALSAARSGVVEAFLYNAGFEGSIVPMACGERVPPEITDADRRSPEELLRLARRVEVFYERASVPPGHFRHCVTR